MANHLNLTNTLFEFDDQNNLAIFSQGKSVLLHQTEVKQLQQWLQSKQKEDILSTSTARMTRGKQSSLTISQKGKVISIPMGEVRKFQDWLQHRIGGGGL